MSSIFGKDRERADAGRVRHAANGARARRRTVLGALICVIFLFAAGGQRAAAQAFAHPDAAALPPAQKGEAYLAGRQFERALQEFRGLIEGGAPESSAFRGLVKAYAGLGRPRDAEAYLRQYLAASPAASPAMYGLGFLYYLEGLDGPAEEWLRRAAAGGSSSALARNALAALLARGKRFGEAVEQVKSAIAIDPLDLKYYQNLQAIYDEMGEPERFAAEFGESLDGDVRQAAGYGKTLAMRLRQQGFKRYAAGDLDAAIRKFMELTDIYRKIDYPEGLVAALFSLGLLFEEKGKPDTAAEYFAEVLRINPEHIQAKEKMKSGR